MQLRILEGESRVRSRVNERVIHASRIQKGQSRGFLEAEASQEEECWERRQKLASGGV